MEPLVRNPTRCGWICKFPVTPWARSVLAEWPPIRLELAVIAPPSLDHFNAKAHWKTEISRPLSGSWSFAQLRRAMLPYIKRIAGLPVAQPCSLPRSRARCDISLKRLSPVPAPVSWQRLDRIVKC